MKPSFSPPVYIDVHSLGIYYCSVYFGIALPLALCCFMIVSYESALLTTLNVNLLRRGESSFTSWELGSGHLWGSIIQPTLLP